MLIATEVKWDPDMFFFRSQLLQKLDHKRSNGMQC